MLKQLDVPFKMASNQRAALDLNDGVVHPTSVGKIFTVYPNFDEFEQTARALVDATIGCEGPRVLSDRRVDGRAPVFYRYGPFTGSWELSAVGTPQLMMATPDGNSHDASAGLRYAVPSGLRDPFAEASDDDESDVDRASVLAQKYHLVSGIRQSARGDVMIAVDLDNDEEVLIKQARAWVAEATPGVDSRMRLRNERRILERLYDVAGIPRVLDHFSLGDDEYLVLELMDGESAYEYAHRATDGETLPYQPSRTRSLAIPAQAWRLLETIHSMNVQWRDVSPGNLLVSAENGQVSFVDFGIAGADDIYFPGGTSGYARPSSQNEIAPQCTRVDTFAMARLLLYLVSGVQPAIHRSDEWAAVAYLTQLSRAGVPESSIEAAIAGDDFHLDTWRHIRDEGVGHIRANPRNDGGARRAADSIESTLRDRLLDVLDWWSTPRPGEYSDSDASIYSGVGGAVWVGMDAVQAGLLQGEDISGVLAKFARAADSHQQSSGLLVGTGGFLAMRSAAVDSPILRDSGVDRICDSIPSAIEWEGVAAADLDLMYGRVGGVVGPLAVAFASDRRVDCRIFEFLHSAANLSLKGYESVITQDGAELAGVPFGRGAAHGDAGILEPLTVALLLGYEDLTQQTATIARNIGSAYSSEIKSADPSPMSSSWCQGATGAARALAAVGVALGDSELMDVAEELADFSISWIDRRDSSSLCCGLTGIGFGILEVGRILDVDYSASLALVDDALSLRSETEGHPGAAVPPQNAPYSWGLGLLGELHWEIKRRVGSEWSFMPSPLASLALRARGSMQL